MKKVINTVAKAARWIAPRIIPGFVWLLFLPFVAVARVFIGVPMWLFFFMRSTAEKALLQRRPQEIRLD